MELKGVPRVMIEHIADLDVHGPIWTDQHIARGSVHHRIHHLRFSVPIHQNQLPVSPPRSLEISPILRKIPATLLFLSLSLSVSLFLSLRDRLVFYFSVRGNFGYFVFLFPFIWVFVPYFLISEVKFKARVVFNLPKMFKKGQPFIICHVFVGVTRAVLNCTAFVSDHCIFI